MMEAYALLYEEQDTQAQALRLEAQVHVLRPEQARHFAQLRELFALRLVAVSLPEQGDTPLRTAMEDGVFAAREALQRLRIATDAAGVYVIFDFAETRRIAGTSAGLLGALTFALQRIYQEHGTTPPFALAATGQVNGATGEIDRVEHLDPKIQAALQVLRAGDQLFYPRCQDAEISRLLRQRACQQGLGLHPVATVAEAIAALDTTALEIVQPADDQVLTRGTPLTLEGQAASAWGAVRSEALGWTSDRQGPLGTGASVAAVTLDKGIHTLTLRATFPSGFTHAVMTHVHVQGKRQRLLARYQDVSPHYRWILWLLLVGVLGWHGWEASRSGPPPPLTQEAPLRMSGGPPGLGFHPVAEGIVQGLSARLAAENVPSSGAQENLERLCADRAELGLVHAHVPPPCAVTRITNVSKSVLHILARQETGITNMAEIVARLARHEPVRLGIGWEGSGTRKFVDAMLHLYGLRSTPAMVAPTFPEYMRRFTAPRAEPDALDVVFFLSVLPGPKFPDLHGRGYRFVPFDLKHLRQRVTRLPAYLLDDTLPPDLYGTGFPDRPVPTVRVPAILIVSPTLGQRPDAPQTIAMVTRLLCESPVPFRRQYGMEDSCNRGFARLAFAGYPLHPGAAAYYGIGTREGPAPWLYTGLMVGLMVVCLVEGMLTYLVATSRETPRRARKLPRDALLAESSQGRDLASRCLNTKGS